MPGPITIFSARKIITMDPAVEEATHVAVRDGIILELGTLEECAVWGPYTLDDRFGDSHIEIVARNTVSPFGSVTITSTGSA